MAETNNFTEWLKNELAQRDWSQGELCRRAGLSSASVSNVLSGQQSPGLKFYQGIATALDMSFEVILRQAGLIAPEPGADMLLGELHYYLSQLPQEEQTRFLVMVKSIWAHYQAEAGDVSAPLPPEVVQKPAGFAALDHQEAVLLNLLAETSEVFKEAVITTVRAWLAYEGVKQED